MRMVVKKCIISIGSAPGEPKQILGRSPVCNIHFIYIHLDSYIYEVLQ